MKTLDYSQDKQQDADNLPTGFKKTYVSPQLTTLGNLRSLTLGGSVGALDSGDTGTKEIPV